MTESSDARYDLITFGRIGIDIYPLQDGLGLEDVETFGKYLGGSATNVAIAAARHGLRSAVITATGDDPFGRFAHRELLRLGVDDRFVGTNPDYHTPVTFCEMFPPDDFPLYFYRDPVAPDLTLRAADLDLDAIRDARIYWATVTGLTREPSRAAHFAAWDARGRSPLTILDLDYRPMFWGSQAEASVQVSRALEHVTVAVGNREECEVAVGETEPQRAADALLERGVELAIVKQGPKGVLAKTRDETVEVPPYFVDVVNGLGAGDGFGGALCHGLLQGWGLERILRFANVAGAIVASRRECSTAMPTSDEVEAILAATDEAARNEGRPKMFAPDTARVISDAAFAQLRTARQSGPDAVAAAFAGRRRRPLIQGDGRLFIVAADHPARGALGVRGDSMAMGDRYDLLQRLALALSRPGVDGVLGTPDILDDLALLGVLDDKIAVGSMNRGGLRGAVFEMDDRFTGHDIPAIVRSGLDAAKLLVRVNLQDAGTARTLAATARAVDAAVAANVPILLEPFMSTWVDGQVVNDLSPEAVITSIAIAAGLGSSSACTWMKLPVVSDMERVMASTTLPTLLLGGDPDTHPEETYTSWERALALPGVHGLMVGRTLLYPQDGDVAQAVDTAASLVHGPGR